jgi:lactoylglutathione lyase
MIVQIIGFIAASLTTISFIPQAVKTWRSRSTDDLSPFMFALFSIGVFSWLMYGVFKKDLPIILANSITFILAGFIMYFILKNRKVCRITHIGIYVNDIENMKKFYVDKFSATSGKIYNNSEKKFSSYFITFSSGAKLEIMHISEFTDGLNSKTQVHFAISVGNKNSVNELTNKLMKNGVKIISMPRTTGDGNYESVICDPEGNQIEITE